MTAMAAEFNAQLQAYLASKGVKFDAAGNIVHGGQFAASPLGLDRLVRKEDSLGSIRELKPPTDHIGLSILPFHEVDSDDVIFDYIKGGLTDGLSPARAEDAESELSQKDDLTYGQGRASIIDWAEKDKYTASDVTRYAEQRRLVQALSGQSVDLKLADPGKAVAQFQAQVARDDARRSRKLYNRIEWLIHQCLWNSAITYNDGKIKFSVDYGRPGGQTNVEPDDWFDDGTGAGDPIGFIMDLDRAHYDAYGVHLRRAITSRKVLQSFWKSNRWIARVAQVVGGTPSSPIDPNYISESWSPEYAIKAVEAATGIKFQEFDSVYRTRAFGSTSIVNTRFSPERNILFLPDQADLGEIDDTEVGFGKTLTSPHPEGNFTPGFYEWEKPSTDPWMHVRGSGVKAFPVAPYMEYTVTATVLAP